METPRTGLARYDAMCTAIAACHRVDEAKEIRDQAKALEVYAHEALNTEAERKAIEIRIRAERRIGELLKLVRLLYFIQASPSGNVKIGVSCDPRSRLAQLQTSSHEDLRIVGLVEGSFRQEKIIHSLFADIRIVGEWFSPDQRLIAFIEGACDARIGLVAQLTHLALSRFPEITGEGLKDVVGYINKHWATNGP